MTVMATHKPVHFLWQVENGVALIRLNRPQRKNPLTFESYAELRDTFRDLRHADDVKAVVFLPNGGNFCGMRPFAPSAASSGGQLETLSSPNRCAGSPSIACWKRGRRPQLKASIWSQACLMRRCNFPNHSAISNHRCFRISKPANRLNMKLSMA